MAKNSRLDSNNLFFSFVCLSCKNYIEGGSCKAFNDIPMEIWNGINRHTEPLKDQTNDIVFEKI